MKNVDELYEKYYNTYKNNYDNDNELKEIKKKEFDYKQFELFDKTDKSLTLDGETEKDKESKLTELPKWFHSKNDFKKAIKLSEDIRADTKNYKSSSGDKKVFNNLDKFINDIEIKKLQEKVQLKKTKNIASDLDQQRQKESIVFQNKMIDVIYYLFNSLELSSKPGRLMLPKWVKVNEERVNEILSTVPEAKNNGFKTNVDGREITLDKAESLLKDLRNGILDGREFKKKYSNIVDDVESILQTPRLTRSQDKMLIMLSLLKEIVEGFSYEESETINMPKLEDDESAEQSGQGLKILTPDQMLSRLPITLAQLKAGNNSEKLKNETTQFVYSLYRSKKLTKQLYKNLVDII